MPDPNSPQEIAKACQRVQSQIQVLTAQRDQLRRMERKMNVKLDELSSVGSGGGGGAPLRMKLDAILPKYLRPGNVGDINEVAWDMSYPVDFSFGANPTLVPTSGATSSFSVSQEAGFLLLGVAVDLNNIVAGFGFATNPFQMTIRDNQSSRQLNDSPIPLPAIGSYSKPSLLPVPYLLLPNASVSVVLSTWLPTGASITTTWNGKIQVIFKGLRVRVDDQSQILSFVYDGSDDMAYGLR